ncbi:hypothetical protein GJAV_G00179630 [Gymnothorax javanicus]|nr:hypothetical protein GJAV_G00179630 [Gymnothorax javanicus]
MYSSGDWRVERQLLTVLTSFPRILPITKEEAQEAFLEYASSKCCYSKKPARDMVFTDLKAHNPYRYRLETFAESRSTKWASEPYIGQMVDGCMGAAPGTWDIDVPIPSLFQKSQKDVRVPRTSSVKGCHTCMTLGRIPCRRCATSGMEQCLMCSGSGIYFSDYCQNCNGRGGWCCTHCSGAGTNICKTCQGRGQLLCFMKLVVKWNNYVYESVVDNHSGLPMDLVSGVTGKILFTNMQPVVYPVTDFPHNVINQVAKRAVRKHQAQYFNTFHIIQQRQTIELIHVTRVCYTWKDKSHVYFVYGAKHKVYTDDYPAKCCCTLL